MVIFLDPMLPLHHSFDGLVNVLENYSLYPVWARGPHLALAGKKIFRAQRHVII